MIKRPRLALCAAVLATVGILAGCGIPRSGPSKREIFAGSVQRQGDAFVVTINDRVTRATSIVPSLGFSRPFKNAALLPADEIQIGDTLNFTVWENVDDGLLASQGAGQTTLGNIQVDGDGFIFVPYAGRIRAKGNTPETIRRIVTQRLSEQTPDPQVEIARQAGEGASVLLFGAVGGGLAPIEQTTRTLTAMLAKAGVAIDPEVAKVRVIRSNRSEEVWYRDLIENPRMDISLRDGDQIYVEEDKRSFVTLGETSQGKVLFDGRTLSALEAIAQSGGLNGSTADPTGVFVLRIEEEIIANSVLGRDDLQGGQRMIYVLDLTQPNGLFMARDFAIRDGDTIFATEAPLSQWNKTIATLLGSLGTASQVVTAVQSLETTIKAATGTTTQ